MWIALSIIAIYVWLFKRKKKTMKQQILKVISVVWLTVATTGICTSQNQKVIIRGEIHATVQNKGKVIVYLIDEKSFKTPLTGIDTVILNPSGKIIHFEFEATEGKMYGVRCYHDINNNGCLDKGMFKPVEPYGFSQESRRRIPLNFTDISFTANSYTYIIIKMRE
jgi:uncharacterized protein (DUF2141 family)